MDGVLALGVATIHIAHILPVPVHASRESEGLQTILVDGLAYQGIGVAIHSIGIGCTLVVITVALRADIRAEHIRCQRLVLAQTAEEIQVERGGEVAAFPIAVCDTLNASRLPHHLLGKRAWLVGERSGKGGLEDIRNRVGKGILQFQTIAKVLGLAAQGVSGDAILRAVVQQILRLFLHVARRIIGVALLVEEVKLALAPMEGGIDIVDATQGGKCIGEVEAHASADGGATGTNVDDISHVPAVPHAGIVDEIHARHRSYVEGLHLMQIGDDAVDAHLHATPLVDGGYGMIGLIDTDIGEHQTAQQGES